MPATKGAKTRKHSNTREISSQPKTRHHSNLRPKNKHSKDFLKVYYPYLPLLTILFVILAIIQPWQSHLLSKKSVLSYATQMDSKRLVENSNSRRRTAGKSDLKLNNSLSKAAQTKADDMIKRDYWAHSTPDGSAPWEFINNANYFYKKAGENLAYGFADEQEVISGWMNSTSHRENLLDPSYVDVGFGFANSDNFVGDGPSTVVVAMYGTPSSSSLDVKPNSQANKLSFNSLGVTDEPQQLGISRVQSLTNGRYPWSPYLVGVIIGGLAVFLLFKHGRRIKRMIVNGEKYILKHPLLDVSIIALISLLVLVSQQVGVIK